LDGRQRFRVAGEKVDVRRQKPEAYGPIWPQAPYLSRDGLAKVMQEVTAQNPKANDLNVDQLMDTSIVKELEDSGFIKQVNAG
jgi:hypothetical protein